MPDFSLERSCRQGPVAGIDEAGRGPWAGPVVAAAVILDEKTLPKDIARQLDDSKVVPPPLRGELFGLLPLYALIGVGHATVEEIDSHNILQATMLAMARAVQRLPVAPAMALVDGNRAPDLALSRAAGGEGRWPQPLHRRRFDHRQGDPRPDHGGPGAAASRLWLGA